MATPRYGASEPDLGRWPRGRSQRALHLPSYQGGVTAARFVVELAMAALRTRRTVEVHVGAERLELVVVATRHQTGSTFALCVRLGEGS